MKVFGFAGWSGSGKTTLIERVIPEITARGLRVSVIKHAHHGFDVDKPGKDSWRHREAGAGEILLVSDERWVLMHEMRGAPEPDLMRSWRSCRPAIWCWWRASRMCPSPRSRSIARPTARRCFTPTTRPSLPLPRMRIYPRPLPCLNLNDPAAVAAFILTHQGLS
jgi:molybdopterin-guanine dinucleotide biosynthesis protein B